MFFPVYLSLAFCYRALHVLSLGQSLCQPCPVGRFLNVAGVSACQQCAEGSSSLLYCLLDVDLIIVVASIKQVFSKMKLEKPIASRVK
jgi:hypothetical protein